MRGKLFQVIILLLSSSYAVCQLECGNHVSEEDVQLSNAYFAHRSSNARRQDTPGKIHIGVVKNFIVQGSDGRTTISEVAIAKEVARANELYSTGPFRFVMDKTTTYESDADFEYDTLFNTDTAIVREKNQNNTFNAYWFNSLCTQAGACYCGYAWFPWYILKRSLFMNSHCLGAIFAHEIGHNIGLYHTHEAFNGVETVDRTGCDTKGDQVCDTPADPNLINKVDISCQYTGSDIDETGRAYEPPVTNVMSYTNDHCRLQFTEGQYRRAEEFIELIKEAFIEIEGSVESTVNGDFHELKISAVSSHFPSFWNVSVGNSRSEILPAVQNSFSHVVTEMPNGNYEVKITACYPYMWPENFEQVCITEIRTVVLTGSVSTTGAVVTTDTTSTSGNVVDCSSSLRNVQINAEDDFLNINSISECQFSKLNVNFTLGSQDLLRIRASYEDTAKSMLDVKFVTLIEYEESGKTEGYQPNEDIEVQRISSNTVNWEKFSAPMPLHQNLMWNFAYTNPEEFYLKVYTSKAVVTMGPQGYQIHPDQVKFDFDFSLGSKLKSSTSKVALEVEVNSMSTSQLESQKNRISDKDGKSSFWWPSLAMSDRGQVVPITVTTPQSPFPFKQVLYFSFDTTVSTKVTWDPSIGSRQRFMTDDTNLVPNREDSSSSNTLQFSFLLSLFVIIFVTRCI